VTVSSNATIASCIIKDGAFIGANASVGENCIIEEGAFIAAGANVPANTTVPANECWAGEVAEFLRRVSPAERENLEDQHHEYIELANIYCEHTEMNFRQWMDDVSMQNEKATLNPESFILYKYQELGLPTEEND